LQAFDARRRNVSGSGTAAFVICQMIHQFCERKPYCQGKDKFCKRPFNEPRTVNGKTVDESQGICNSAGVDSGEGIGRQVAG